MIDGIDMPLVNVDYAVVDGTLYELTQDEFTNELSVDELGPIDREELLGLVKDE